MKHCRLHNNPENCISLVPIFSSLTLEEMNEIASITESRTYEKGEMIYMSGDQTDKLYVLHLGLVKLTQYSLSGKEQVIRLLKPGDFMGEYNLFSKKSFEENSEAVKKSTMCIIEGQKLRQLMQKNPSIAFKIIEEMTERLVRAERLLKNVAIESVEKRIADKLLALADECNIVRLDMPKKDLASMMGMSAETLSRKLTKFEKMKIIKQNKYEIAILNEDALFEID